MFSLLFVFVSLSFIIACINGDIIIETKSGKVSGITKKTVLENKEYFSFLGIPFAEPPIDDLRFMPPQPKRAWDDILIANKEPTACAQFYIPIRSKDVNVGYFGDEDCLYLSVHTPQIDHKELHPVIVFTFHENFRYSYNGSRDLSPDFFMEEGVIIVTINHRLGSIGFLGFEDDLLPGNNGLRDVILALNWVKENIESFGGDPNRVTLMGAQGGATTTDTLLHSKKAKGLFHGAILQSGTIWNSMYLGNEPRREAILLSDLVDKKASTSTTLIKNLRKVPASQLLEVEIRAVDMDEGRAKQRGILTFGPIIEHDHADAVLTARPEDIDIDIDIPIMVGYNSREGIEMSTRYLNKPNFLTYADRDFMFLFPIRTNYHFRLLDQIYREIVQEVKDFYFDEGYVKISKPGEFITYIGDIIQMYPIDYMVRKYVNASSAPIYYYTFDYSGRFNMHKIDTLKTATSWDDTWGATKGDEKCYLFVCNPLKKTYAEAAKNPEEFEELKVIKKMVRLWSNFARTGNPTPPQEDDILDGFIWEPVTKDERKILEISKDLTMKSNLHAGRIKFWDDFLEKYEKRAVNGVVRDQKDEL